MEAYRREAKLIADIGLRVLTNKQETDPRIAERRYSPPLKSLDEYTDAEYREYLAHIPDLSKAELNERLRMWRGQQYRTLRHEWAVCRRRHLDEQAEILRSRFEAIGLLLGFVDQGELGI